MGVTLSLGNVVYNFVEQPLNKNPMNKGMAEHLRKQIIHR